MSAQHTSSCTKCGWTSNPTRSPAQAAHALRLHSCDRWRTKAEAAARGRARAAAVDRAPKTCRHPHADHQHGTHACYVLDRCRCHPCTQANAAYEKHRIRQTAYGRFNPFVSASHARAHVFHLMSQGMGAKTIATRAGVSYSTLGRIIYGRGGTSDRRFEPPSKKLRKDTADKLLAVRASIDTLAPGAKINGTGTRRRLQGLVALGWSQSQLARQLGWALRNLNYVVLGKRGVTVRTHRAVAHLYDQLWDTRPTPANRFEQSGITRSVNYAKARGWVPPMAWDDESIDDATATPDLGQRPRSRARKVHLDDVEFLIETHDYTWPRLTQQLDVSRNAIETALIRAGRRDLLARLARNETARGAA